MAHSVRGGASQSRSVSKWSYSSVKELLLSASTKTFPTHTEPPVSTEFTATLANPQCPFVCEAIPTSYRDVATANTAPPTLEEPPGHADGDRPDIPTVSLENGGVPLLEDATEGANATGVATLSNSTGHLADEAELVFRLSKNLYISPNMRTDYST